MRKLLSLLFVCFGMVSYAQLCAGSTGTINAQNPQNLGNPQYSLNPGGFFPISGTNQFAITPTATTTYTIYTTGTNTANVVVTTTAVLQVTVLPQPIATPTVIQPSCTSTIAGFNLGLTWLPPSPVPGYTVVWSSIPNGVLTSQQTSVASGVAAGPYTATIVANGGCGYITSFTVNPPPAPALFTLTPFSSTMTLNCITPTIDITASNNALSYTWASTCSAPVTQTNAVNLNSVCLGNYTVTGVNELSGCSKTLTFTLVQDISVPSSTVTPMLQNITCTSGINPVSVISSPSINIAQTIVDPQGGIFAATSYTTIYGPGGVGQFTCTSTNLVNGCSTVKVFTVTSSQGFPTYNVVSPQSFTLGCNSKSVAIVNINDATASTPGAGVSYTLLAPGASTVLPNGTLSGINTYSVNTAGQYTIVVRELPSNCETRSSISIITNTAAPQISTTQDFLLLDCTNTVTTLYGSSETPNVSPNWAWDNFNVPSSTVSAVANFAARTTTVVETYTFSMTDISSTCKSTSVVSIYQNLYLPKPAFSAGVSSITCLTPTITLTNISTTGIPSNVVLPIVIPTQPVIGYRWQGPTPQVDVNLSTTYVAGISGVYTITAKDMNNGCVATATQSIDDYRDFPTITISPNPGKLNCGDAISLTASTTQSADVTPLWVAPTGVPTGPKNGFVLSGILNPRTYTFIATNKKNGCVSSSTVGVTDSKITADFSIDKIEGYAPLTVLAINNSSTEVNNKDITSYFSFGNGTYSSTPQTSINVTTVYKQPGTYSLAMNVMKGACVDTAIIFINVLLPSKLEIPNAFSPNGDGVNDFYFLNAASMSEVTFTIHDRWGHLVYEVTSRTGNVLWDGKNQSDVEVPEGTYFYILKATGKDGTTYDQNGTIQLFR